MVLQEQGLWVQYGWILSKQQSLYLYKLNVGICLRIVAELGRVTILIFVGFVCGFGLSTGGFGLDIGIGGTIQSTVIIIHNRWWRLTAGWHGPWRQSHALSVTQIITAVG